MMQTATNNEDQERTYYIGHVTPGLWQHPGLSMGAKSAATVLLMHRNEKNGCYVTQELLALEVGRGANRPALP